MTIIWLSPTPSFLLLVSFVLLLHLVHISSTNSAIPPFSSQQQVNKRLISEHYLTLFTQNEAKLPDISGISIDTNEIEILCPKNTFYSSMNPTHMKAVNKMTSILFAEPNIEKALQMAEYLKSCSNINIKAWYSAVTSWALKDPRLSSVVKPSPVDVMPDWFINNQVVTKAHQSMSGANLNVKENDDECIIQDGSAGIDNGVENALWYFREDLMMNANHFFFHNSYPIIPSSEGPEVVRREDRRGELFYFFHRDALARYNAERLSNGLKPVIPLVWGEGNIIEEGYISHLNESMSGRAYGDREPNTPLSDLDFVGGTPTPISYIVTLGERLMDAVWTSSLLMSNGSIYPLNHTRGIDFFIDALEENSYSLNPEYYGKTLEGLHNTMHFALAFAPDPTGELNIPPGVMLNIATSFRDIIFYRWHAYLNEVFDLNKRTLRPYTPTGGELPLIWPGVTINGISILPAENLNSSNSNQLYTYFGSKRFQLRRGLDHGGNFSNPAYICAKHLDHQQFYYKLVLDNTHTDQTPATVRIFLAPRYNENGTRFDLLTQRNFFFNLDVFTTNLTFGENIIWRASNETNAAVPWAKTYDELENGDPTSSNPYCGCGLPLHLQIPRGSVNGMTYDLFVMVTNGEDDAVEHETNDCQAAYLYCGLSNTLYPDSKPMAYPFDRLPYNNANGSMVGSIEEYVQPIPNMKTIQVNITHLENA